MNMPDTLDFATLRIGQALPELRLPAIDRTLLALFAGASGDHNPIHIDLDFARRAGLPDVFAQGMLPMAWLGRLLTDWVPQRQIRRLNARFNGIVQLGDMLTCQGRVEEKRDGERLLKLAIACVNQHGDIKLSGDALIAF